MTEPTVLLTVDDGIATITLNRPEARNALNQAMRPELAAAITRVRDDDKVLAVILTGAGDAFNGALAASLAAGNTLVQAATWASAFASLAVELEGASNMPDFAQANARLRTL